MIDSSTPPPWLRNYKPNPRARLRLFCFPYAGGSTLSFRAWQENLLPDIEVCPVQLPGRGNRVSEAPFTNYDLLVRASAGALLPYLNKPFALFGHSMGAMLSFELARLLRSAHNLQPEHLFVSARRAPQVSHPEPPTHDLPEADFVSAVSRLNGLPKEVLEQPELMQLMVPLLRADFAVCETYTYVAGPALSCPITAFGGLQDREVTREHIEPWREQTTGQFSLRMLPGDHFFLNTAQQFLLRVIAQTLSSAYSF
jgi:medium-chain acyl-[acyl-carrier-protein] hydrolase